MTHTPHHSKRRSLGQGMTEYIIIVALIAIAAIAAFTMFGDVVRGQVGTMASELGGNTASNSSKVVATQAAKADTLGAKHATLQTYSKEGGNAAAGTK
ncbi:MAG: pilus assembly protein [Gammaproteobacteria bacterium CG22_combo_CG10-13_8_21_14_all_40_8]|nr:MAG: pilus assembly protein [Gammaproteobacteria bacterium CG22_combo_CG10-13_8_21_14_all_40_8]